MSSAAESFQLGKADPQLEVIPQRKSQNIMAINGNGNQPTADQKDLQEGTKREADHIVSSEAQERISPIALLNLEDARRAEDAILRDAVIGQVVEQGNQQHPVQQIAQADAKREVDEICQMMLSQSVSSQAPETIARIALVKLEMARGVEDDMLRAAQIWQIVGKVSTCSIGLAPAEEEKYQDDGFGDGFKFYDNCYEEQQSFFEVEGLLTDLNAHTAAVDDKSEDDGDIAFLTTVRNRFKVEDDGFGDGFKFYDVDFCSGYDDHDAVYDDHFDWDQPEDDEVYWFDDDVAILDCPFNWDQPEDDVVYLFDGDLAILTTVLHQADEDDCFGDGFQFYEFAFCSGNTDDGNESEDERDAVDDDHFDWDQPEDDVVYLFDGDLAILTTVRHEADEDDCFGDGFQFYEFAFCSGNTDDGSESEDERDAVDDDHFDWDQLEDDVVYLFDGDLAILTTVRHQADEDDCFGFQFYEFAFCSGNTDDGSESEDERDAVDDDHFDWDQPEDDVVYLFDGDLAILTTVRHQTENESDEDEEKVEDSAFCSGDTGDDSDSEGERLEDQGFGDRFNFWDQPEDDDLAILTTVRQPEDDEEIG